MGGTLDLKLSTNNEGRTATVGLLSSQNNAIRRLSVQVNKDEINPIDLWCLVLSCYYLQA